MDFGCWGGGGKAESINKGSASVRSKVRVRSRVRVRVRVKVRVRKCLSQEQG